MISPYVHIVLEKTLLQMSVGWNWRIEDEKIKLKWNARKIRKMISSVCLIVKCKQRKRKYFFFCVGGLSWNSVLLLIAQSSSASAIYTNNEFERIRRRNWMRGKTCSVSGAWQKKKFPQFLRLFFLDDFISIEKKTYKRKEKMCEVIFISTFSWDNGDGNQEVITFCCVFNAVLDECGFEDFVRRGVEVMD